MTDITISSKFQIVIPKSIREELALEPGQKIRAICIGDRIELLPINGIQTGRGFLKGISTQVERETDRL